MKNLLLIVLSVLSIGVSGQEVFNYLYGSTGLDGGNSILPLANGEYVIAGSTSSFNGDQDGYFLRLAADGQLLSSSAIGGPNVDYFQRLIGLSETEFLCVGTTNSFGSDYDIFWALVDINGVVSDEGFIDSGDWDLGIDVIIDLEGNIYILGETYAGNTGRDLVLYKFDVNFDEQWSYQFINEGDDFAGRMVLNTLGNVIVGATKANELDTDAWLLEIAPDASVVQEWNHGGEGNQSIYGLEAAEDGDYLALGSDDGPLAEWGETDMLIMRFNPDGTEAWAHYFGGGLMDFGKDLLEMPNGDIVITSEMNSFGNGIPEKMNIQTYRLSSGGWWQSQGNLNIGSNGAEKVRDIALTNDGGYIMVGQADDNATTADYCHVVKVDSLNTAIFLPDVLADPNDINELQSKLVAQLFPNPASDDLTIRWSGSAAEFNIMSADGRLVERVQLIQGENEIDLSGYAPGCYSLISASPNTELQPVRFLVIK
ncbi:MAG: hypothetical protein ACI943_002447 [Gammaproteobacteria bacterium]|jgi:hypothetical protein